MRVARNALVQFTVEYPPSHPTPPKKDVIETIRQMLFTYFTNEKEGSKRLPDWSIHLQRIDVDGKLSTPQGTE